MDTLIVYHSVFGNTRAVVEAIAAALSEKGAVRLIEADRFSAPEPGEAELLIVGCPTHRHNVPAVVRDMFERMHRGALRGLAVAAFDTRYHMPRWKSGSAALRVARKLRRYGGRQVVPPESFFVAAREGPLAAGEAERAWRWARAIAEGLPAGREKAQGRRSGRVERTPGAAPGSAKEAR